MGTIDAWETKLLAAWPNKVFLDDMFVDGLIGISIARCRTLTKRKSFKEAKEEW